MFLQEIKQITVNLKRRGFIVIDLTEAWIRACLLGTFCTCVCEGALASV
jgi:hypothetical protein